MLLADLIKDCETRGHRLTVSGGETGIFYGHQDGEDSLTFHVTTIARLQAKDLNDPIVEWVGKIHSGEIKPYVSPPPEPPTYDDDYQSWD